MVGRAARTRQTQAKICGIVIRLLGCGGEQLELILGNHVLVELNANIEVGNRIGVESHDIALGSALADGKHHAAVRCGILVFLRDHLFDLGHALLFKAQIGRIRKRTRLRLGAVDLLLGRGARSLLAAVLTALLVPLAGKAAKQHGNAQKTQ